MLSSAQHWTRFIGDMNLEDLVYIGDMNLEELLLAIVEILDDESEQFVKEALTL